MRNLLILFFALPIFAIGQITPHEQWVIENQEKAEKEYIFQITAPTMLLMELYMMEINEKQLHIGWSFILTEEVYKDGSSMSTGIDRYYPIALDYLMPYDFDHEYRGKILYGLDPNLHIEEYRYQLEDYGIDQPYIRTEKIMVPKKPSFEDFYYWTKKYFAEQFKEE